MAVLFLIGIFGMLCFVAFGVLSYSKRKEPVYNYTPEFNSDLKDIEIELCRLINQHRLNLGLNPVIPEVLASEVCKDIIYADIANGRKPSHVGWENRVKQCQAELGGEICGYGINSALGFFMEYIKSKSHRECIENPIYTHIGISIIENRNYCIFVKYD